MMWGLKLIHWCPQTGLDVHGKCFLQDTQQWLNVLENTAKKYIQFLKNFCTVINRSGCIPRAWKFYKILVLGDLPRQNVF